ncbi:pentatricopeptide repeat-containing protein At1g55890, mitochondrial-like [Nymphaea colorata]|uniref:Pentacotripeptide-repeat region of PRORP domain-containing protein n=1 Tax=Nymphaea colorata TaxID=210225 RepID=A0A5K0W1W9_9MAGN|nr:pentatricopeptide repeat-containing protein At1g55890, mitochondrial-like [Nymphaea colorata]
MASSDFLRVLLRTRLRLLNRCFSTATITDAATKDGTTTTNARVKIAVNQIFRERNYDRLVEKFKECSKEYRFRCKHNVYERTVRRLAAAKRFSNIEDILEEQKKYAEVASEGFFIRLITLYGRAGMLQHAMRTFDELPTLGCERTVKSMNAVLTACADTKNFATVKTLFHELPEKLGVTPDIYSYNILALAFCEMGSLDLAFSLLEEMKKNGVSPNTVTFNTLLNGFYRSNQRSEAEKVWTEMENCGVMPDTKTFNAKMRGLIVEGKAKEAVKVIDELESKGLKPDTVSFNILIKALCEEDDAEEVKKMVCEMKTRELLLNRMIYETVIPALCKGEFIDMAYELCEEALNRNCFIKPEVLQEVINRLVAISEDEKAKQLVDMGSGKSYYDSKFTISLDS